MKMRLFMFWTTLTFHLSCMDGREANGFHPLAPYKCRSSYTTNYRNALSLAVYGGSMNQDGDPKHIPLTLEAIAKKLASNSYRNVIVVMGAGASVSAGIPDFRSQGTGLYDNLDKYNLPSPEAVFSVDYYKQNPQPFIDLCQSLWPNQKGGPRPTSAHVFLKLLQDKGILRRVYTQNIDSLEVMAKVDTEDILVECHGHFRSARCIQCRSDADIASCMDSILTKKKVPVCTKCGGYVKPDVVFFGEELPQRFQDTIDEDIANSDLLVIIGTSLLVMPVAGIPSWVKSSCQRLLLNRELVGDIKPYSKRDVFEQGDCDDGVLKLCQWAGWEKELLALHNDISR